MKVLKAIIIDLLARASRGKYTSFDVAGAGPRVVAGVAESLGIEVDLISYEKAMRSVDFTEYDLVMASAMSSDLGSLKRILKRAFIRNKNAVRIVGGPISSEFYEVMLKLPEVDLVVVGEAEVTLSKLLTKGLSPLIQREFHELHDIDGIAYRAGDRIVFTGFPEYASEEVLNSVKPFTRVNEAYDNVWIYRFYVEVVRGCSNFSRPMVNLDSSRACLKCYNCRSNDLLKRLECPAKIMPGCGFCSVAVIHGPPRSRSQSSIINEVKELIRRGARRIVLSAPDFLDYGRNWLVKPKPLTNPCMPKANLDALERLLEEISNIDEVSSGEVRIFVENVKACLIDEEVAKLLGTYLKGTPVNIGLETCVDQFNDKVLGKPITLREVIRGVKLLQRHGIRPYVYIMYGLPYVDREIYLKTISAMPKLFKAGVEKITLYKFTPLPLTSFEFLKPSIGEYAELIEELKAFVNRLNALAKKNYLGKSIDVLTLVVKGRAYGYPVDHGPVVFIGNSNELRSGCIATVRITDVRSRHVVGELINVKKCYE